MHVLCTVLEQFARSKCDMNLKKDDGFSAIHLAALNDHLDVLTALAELVAPEPCVTVSSSL